MVVSNFITGNLSEDMNKIDRMLHINESFDILKKQTVIGNHQAVFYFINGFCQEDLMQRLEESLYKIREADVGKDPKQFADRFIPYVEVDLYADEYNVIKFFLSGVTCFLVNGFQKAILIDTRQYPARNVMEPEKYKVLRGSRDGFVETIVYNTALIRRRIRSPEYLCEIVRAGESSRTDIAICYMKDRVDPKLLARIKKQLSQIRVDALPMNQESLAECLYKGHWFNPFPKFRYTERPDTAAAEILEGQIAILVDNSPAAMLLPTTIFDVIEEADDYYFPPVTGTYLRLARAFMALMSFLLIPLFLLFANNQELIPQWLSFAKYNEVDYVPIFWQIMLLELSIDGLKLAAINTPSTLNTPLSLIAAIVIGDYAVQTHWFNPHTMLYMAVVAIANFTHENYELAYSIKFLRIIAVVLTQLFGIYGFILGCIVAVLAIVLNKTIAETSYIEPLLPFRGKAFLERFFRVSLKSK
ncbi:MAG: spore germination protein [Eubacterium sp.]|nr:spore germination protein [Eubacterium sp.]